MRMVTVSQKANEAIQERAKKVAKQLHMTYVPRWGRSLPDLAKQYDTMEILVLSKQGPVLYTGEETEHRFHLSMAQLRMIRLDRGETDHLVEAIQTEHLTSFLDCTAGLGSDSLIASYAYPNCRRFLGLEGNPLLAYITNDGLRHFTHKNEKVIEALQRIQIAGIRYETFLANAADASFDVVYFDPMFDIPVKESPQFLALRGHTLETSITPDTLAEAKRVAKKKVVIKERPFGRVFKEFPPDELLGGKYSRVAYGVYHCKSDL